MEDLFEQLTDENANLRQIAYTRLLYYYKENEAVYYITMRKPKETWSDKVQAFMDRMERIRERLEL